MNDHLLFYKSASNIHHLINNSSFWIGPRTKTMN